MATKLHGGPVYGPVHSRRLGLSLGINLLPTDGKICSFDCIYCECGSDAERRTKSPFPTAARIGTDLEPVLRDLDKQGQVLNSITLAGNGEPTLNPEFAQIVDVVLRLRDELAPKAEVSVISNGTRAGDPAVHDALMRVDSNLFKLDTVDPDYIAFLDQPVAAYDVRRQIELARSFGGHVTIQTMFLRGTVDGRDVDNTAERYVGPWLDAVREIGPEEVTVYTVARDTPTPGLEKAPAEVLDAIADRVRALGIPCTVGY